MRISEAKRVYFETTILNRYFEDGRECSTNTKCLFDMIPSSKVEAFTSTAVLEKISRVPEPKRGQMMGLTKRFGMTVLEVEQPAYDLADVYIEMEIIPTKYRLDGVHIAIAAVNDLDCIVSLNSITSIS